MASRLNMQDLADWDYYKEMIRTEANIHKYHQSTRKCQESRWPHTGQLSFDEIALMRDTYMGRRTYASQHKTVSIFDRIFHMDTSWDQKTERDTRIAKRIFATHAYTKDNQKPVPILTNNVYGHRQKNFYDWLSKSHDNRSEYVYEKGTFKRDKICTLPPLDGNLRRRHLHHDNNDN